MKIIGFIEDKLINKIVYLSDNWILYYEKNDDESEIRAANYNRFGKFFDLDSGETIPISNLLNFELVNDTNMVIFDSKDKVSDFDLAVQYRFFQSILNGENGIDQTLKN